METGRSEENASTIISIRSIDITPINRDILKKVARIHRKGNRHMTPGVGKNRQPLYCQSNLRATSSAEKPPSRVHPTIDKGKILIACSSNNTPTVLNTERGKEVIRLKKKEKPIHQR